jgi:hypothetical protein
MGHRELGGQPVDIVEVPITLVLVLLFQFLLIKVRVTKGMLARGRLGSSRGVGSSGGGAGLELLGSLSFGSGDSGCLSGGLGVGAFTGVSRGGVGERDVLVLCVVNSYGCDGGKVVMIVVIVAVVMSMRSRRRRRKNKMRYKKRSTSADPKRHHRSRLNN